MIIGQSGGETGRGAGSCVQDAGRRHKAQRGVVPLGHLGLLSLGRLAAGDVSAGRDGGLWATAGPQVSEMGADVYCSAVCVLLVLFILSIHVLMMVTMVCDDEMLLVVMLIMAMTELSSESQAVIDAIDPHPCYRCYCSAITACGRGGKWRQALDLLDVMHRNGPPPNDVSETPLRPPRPVPEQPIPIPPPHEVANIPWQGD